MKAIIAAASVALFCAAALAQDYPQVAVYVSGDVPDYMKTYLSARLLSAVNGGADVTGGQIAAFQAAADEERANRNEALNDSLICELGRQHGIRFICVASINPVPGAFKLSGRIMSTKTGKSKFDAEAAGPLNTMDDLGAAAATLRNKMFADIEKSSGGQTAPPTPEPAQTVQFAPATETAAQEAENVPQPVIAYPVTADTVADEPVAVETTTVDTIATEPAETYYAIPNPAVKPPSMRIKYIAVVESDIDVASGAATEMTSAEVRLITAELRREAVKNLPPNRYNVMTTETVMSQGSEVLNECAEENCVITLGSKIGADYIVRGTISKFQTLFTLTVDIFETKDGNLVASSDPVRSEDISGLLENAATVCADMYRTFAAARTPPPPPPSTPPPPPTPLPPPAPTPPPRKPIKFSIGAGGLFAGGYGGGVTWPDGGRIKMPYSAAGAYLFLDATYAELLFGYSAGNGQWESNIVIDSENLPYMPRAFVNIGLFAKYPLNLHDRAKFFPLLGLDYEAAVSGRIDEANGGYAFDGADNHPETSAISSLWFKFGAGIDLYLGKAVYIRSELIYGARAANAFEQSCADKLQSGAWAEFGQGIALKIGLGIRL